MKGVPIGLEKVWTFQKRASVSNVSALQVNDFGFSKSSRQGCNYECRMRHSHVYVCQSIQLTCETFELHITEVRAPLAKKMPRIILINIFYYMGRQGIRLDKYWIFLYLLHSGVKYHIDIILRKHYRKYEPLYILTPQTTIYSYVHHRIPQSTRFSIVQTSYLNNPQFRVMYTIAFLKVRDFQLSKRHISTIHNLELCTPSHSSKYEIFNCPNVISQQSTI